ncbi:MAG TPA: divalent-cation tolerance protein CutA [Gammaproteobacteria bacterium]
MRADFLLVLTTCADAAQGHDLATALVGERLAACVNAVPRVSSTYRWDGKIEHADECLLLIKTTRDRFEALEKAIKARSRYSLPEIIAVQVDRGSAEYLGWVEASVQPGGT